MASEWKTVRLGDLTTWASGGTPPKANPIFWNGDIPWISASSMKTPLLCNSDLKITKEGLENGSRLAETNSILLLVRGSELHKRIPIGIATRPVAFNQDVKALNVCGDMRSDYLFYWLLGNETMLLGKVEHTGIGAGKLDTQVLKNLPLALPPLAEQKAIAAVLGALDDKIELNRRMNATLEGMARALFQSWFVDFDPVRAKLDGRKPEGMDKATAALFPDAFEESSLGPVPKGWKVGMISDLATLNRGAVNPGDFPTETFDHFSLPSFDNGRTPKVELGSAIMSNKFTVLPNSVLLSKLNPHIPRIWLPDLNALRRSVCSTEFMVVCSKLGVSREYLFSLFTSSAFASIYGTLVTGTTGSHQRIRPESVLEMKIVIPPPPLIQAFTDIAKPIFDRINRNTEQSRTLAILRDTLLPKLLSGELSVASSKVKA